MILRWMKDDVAILIPWRTDSVVMLCPVCKGLEGGVCSLIAAKTMFLEEETFSLVSMLRILFYRHTVYIRQRSQVPSFFLRRLKLRLRRCRSSINLGRPFLCSRSTCCSPISMGCSFRSCSMC